MCRDRLQNRWGRRQNWPFRNVRHQFLVAGWSFLRVCASGSHNSYWNSRKITEKREKQPEKLKLRVREIVWERSEEETLVYKTKPSVIVPLLKMDGYLPKNMSNLSELTAQIWHALMFPLFFQIFSINAPNPHHGTRSPFSPFFLFKFPWNKTKYARKGNQIWWIWSRHNKNN